MSLEALGICTVDAGGDTNVPGMAKLYRDLDKTTFAVCDKQSQSTEALIEAQVELLLMHEESGFENLVLKGTTEDAIKRFTKFVNWPPHLKAEYPEPEKQPAAALEAYFNWSKPWGIADFLAQCNESEIPLWLRQACLRLKDTCIPTRTASDAADAPADGSVHPGAGADAPY